MTALADKGTFQRLSAPFTAWLSGFSRMPPQKQIAIGVAASIFIHLQILGIVLLFAMVIPHRTEETPLQNRLEIQLVPMPNKAIDTKAGAEPEARDVIDPRGMQASPTKPLNPQFESDRDMTAGSEAAPSGLLPLPSQEGGTDRIAPDFANTDIRIGVAPEPPPPAAPQPAESQPAAQQAPAPSLPPLYDPNPVKKEKLDAAQTAKLTEPIPEPARPHATPPPLKKTANPTAEEIAIAPATDSKSHDYHTQDMPKYVTASLATPKPFTGPSFTQKYQESLKKTRVEGSISNRGRAGVDAVATPLGRYMSQVKTALGSSWGPLVNQRMSLLPQGSATFSFTITQEGRVVGVRMENNSSNSLFADLCDEAIRRAPIPPLPVDLIPSLRDRGLEYGMTFSIYAY